MTVTLKSSIIVAPELWTCSLLPEGVLENWLIADGSDVEAGEAVAKVRIEDSLHDLIAPAGGRLQVGIRANSMVDPGSVVGQIVRKPAEHSYFEIES